MKFSNIIIGVILVVCAGVSYKAYREAQLEFEAFDKKCADSVKTYKDTVNQYKKFGIDLAAQEKATIENMKNTTTYKEMEKCLGGE